MTKKDFWRSASNWGLICGAALFVMNIVGWLLKLETTSGGWLYELLLFIVICPLIIYTGRRNAALCGAEGYSYGRAVGYVFAMMLFAGIAYGVGRFVMVNFIARDYYDAISAGSFDALLQAYQGTPMEEQMITMRHQGLRLMSNPIVLIINGIIMLVCKGGFLGLILSPIFTRKPDFFAPSDNE
jgi:hypothetical protein